jgi:hypothetical protein
MLLVRGDPEMKIIIALFLSAHGLVHAGLAAAPNPGDPDARAGAFFTSPERSWLFNRLGSNQNIVQWIGIILVAIATVGYVLAGLGVFGVSGLEELWRSIAVVSSIFSLILLVLFWHTWLILGVVIDIAILLSLLWINWPGPDLLGQ